MFLMATQSLRGSTVSGGFISGLTISLFTFINSIVEGLLTSTEVDSFFMVFSAVSIFSLITFLYVYFVAYKSLRSDTQHAVSVDK